VSAINTNYIGLALNQGYHGERSVTNCLSHGMGCKETEVNRGRGQFPPDCTVAFNASELDVAKVQYKGLEELLCLKGCVRSLVDNSTQIKTCSYMKVML
jgi:hypothetical protein